MAEAAWFGGRLRELREQAGLTQQQLAEHAGVSAVGINQWERGVREPGWSNVIALATALGVDCTAFAQEPSERPPPGPGRPPKLRGAELEKPKRPRGRPRKTAG